MPRADWGVLSLTASARIVVVRRSILALPVRPTVERTQHADAVRFLPRLPSGTAPTHIRAMFPAGDSGFVYPTA